MELLADPLSAVKDVMPEFYNDIKGNVDKTLRGLTLLRQKMSLRKGKSSEANQEVIMTGRDDTKAEVEAWFTDVERFLHRVGGRERLTAFIEKLSQESGTGEIYVWMNKQKNVKERKADLIPRKEKK